MSKIEPVRDGETPEVGAAHDPASCHTKQFIRLSPDNFAPVRIRMKNPTSEQLHSLLDVFEITFDHELLLRCGEELKAGRLVTEDFLRQYLDLSLTAPAILSYRLASCAPTPATSLHVELCNFGSVGQYLQLIADPKSPEDIYFEVQLFAPGPVARSENKENLWPLATDVMTALDLRLDLLVPRDQVTEYTTFCTISPGSGLEITGETRIVQDGQPEIPMAETPAVDAENNDPIIGESFTSGRDIGKAILFAHLPRSVVFTVPDDTVARRIFFALGWVNDTEQAQGLAELVDWFRGELADYAQDITSITTQLYSQMLPVNALFGEEIYPCYDANKDYRVLFRTGPHQDNYQISFQRLSEEELACRIKWDFPPFADTSERERCIGIVAQFLGVAFDGDPSKIGDELSRRAQRLEDQPLFTEDDFLQVAPENSNFLGKRRCFSFETIPIGAHEITLEIGLKVPSLENDESIQPEDSSDWENDDEECGGY